MSRPERVSNRHARRGRPAVVGTLAAVLALVVLPTVLIGAKVAEATTPSLLDTFTRADNWQIGVAETGQPWQVWSGTAVLAGEAAAASVPGYTLAVADGQSTAGTVSMTVPVASNEFWMIFRASNSGNYWRFGRWQGGPYELQQIAGWALGSPQVVPHAAVSAANGDVVACELTSGVSCSVNGVTVVSSADGFNQSATMLGFAMADGSAAPTTRIDDVRFEPAPPSADIAVNVVATAESVASGTAAGWMVTVANVGTAPADAVQVSMPVPSGLGSASASVVGGTCSVDAAITCDLATMAANQSAVVQIAGTALPPSGVLTLTATASSASADGNPLNDSDSEELPIDGPIPANAVVVDNFARPDAYSLGVAPTGQVWQGWNGTAHVVNKRALASEPGYMLSMIDAGTATGSVIVSVPVISSDFWIAAHGSNSGNYWRFGSTAGGPYKLEQIRDWALAAPPVDTYATVQPAAGDRLACRFLTGITCSVNGVDVASSADPFNSAATNVGIAAYGPSAPAVRFDDFRATTALPAPNLVVEVTVAAKSVLAGATMSWTATVRNTGAVSASDVVATAAAPSGLPTLVVSSSGGACTVAGGQHSCSLGEIAPAGSATITFQTVAPSAIGSFPLTVEAGPVDADGDRSDNRNGAAISVRVLAGPGDYVTDEFNRPDASTLGQEQHGRPWEQWRGTIGVIGQQAAKTDNLPGMSATVIDPGFTFGTMDVTVTSGASDGFGIMFRAKDADNYYLLSSDSTGYYRVQKVLGGRLIGLQFNAIRANVNPADGDRIRLVLRPDDGWFVAVNGVHILDGGDVDLLGEFRFGLAIGSSNVRLDDVRISQTTTTGLVTTESFSHPHESNLELRTPSSGTRYVWLTPNGYWMTSNATGVLDSPGYGLARLETSSQLATIRARILSSGNEAWVVFRHADDGSYYRFGYAIDSGRRYTIERVDSTGETVPVPGGVARTNRARAAGDVVEIRQGLDGSISGYVNGVLAASAVDPTNNFMGTAYGIAGLKGATFDDVVITPQ